MGANGTFQMLPGWRVWTNTFSSDTESNKASEDDHTEEHDDIEGPFGSDSDGDASSINNGNEKSGSEDNRTNISERRQLTIQETILYHIFIVNNQESQE